MIWFSLALLIHVPKRPEGQTKLVTQMKESKDYNDSLQEAS